MFGQQLRAPRKAIDVLHRRSASLNEHVVCPSVVAATGSTRRTESGGVAITLHWPWRASASGDAHIKVRAGTARRGRVATGTVVYCFSLLAVDRNGAISHQCRWPLARLDRMNHAPGRPAFTAAPTARDASPWQRRCGGGRAQDSTNQTATALPSGVTQRRLHANGVCDRHLDPHFWPFT